MSAIDLARHVAPGTYLAARSIAPTHASGRTGFVDGCTGADAARSSRVVLTNGSAAATTATAAADMSVSHR